MTNLARLFKKFLGRRIAETFLKDFGHFENTALPRLVPANLAMVTFISAFELDQKIQEGPGKDASTSDDLGTVAHGK